jgi:hypothetical protein
MTDSRWHRMWVIIQKHSLCIVVLREFHVSRVDVFLVMFNNHNHSVKYLLLRETKSQFILGSSWSWSYGSWIYTYLCISAYHHYRCEFEPCTGSMCSIQHYVKSFSVTCSRSVVFLRVLRCPTPITLTATI